MQCNFPYGGLPANCKDDEGEARNHLYQTPKPTNKTMQFQFNFNIKKPRRNTIVNKPVSDYTIIQRGIIGICCVDIDGNFCCIAEDRIYNFTKRSYKVFNGILYTTQLIDGKVIKAIKLDNIPQGGYKKSYMMPFMAGVCCKGNIVKYNVNHELQFDFKYSFTNWKADKTKLYFKFYKEHYEEIRQKFIEEDYVV